MIIQYEGQEMRVTENPGTISKGKDMTTTNEFHLCLTTELGKFRFVLSRENVQCLLSQLSSYRDR